MKSNIYVSTTGTTSVVANGNVPLNTIIRRYSCCISLNGNSVILTEPGYYLVNVNATFTAPAAGNVSLTLQQNGTNITTASGTATITTATTEQRSLSFSAIIRVINGATPSTLTLINNGVAANYSIVGLSVVKC